MSTPRRKASQDQPPAEPRRNSRKAGPKDASLEILSPDAAQVVLQRLLDLHPELRGEANRIAASPDALPPHDEPSTEDVALDVYSALTAIDLEDLNSRAGAHSWGYVGPSEAAWELLEESIEEWIDDMKAALDSGDTTAAETLCLGIVQGLYRARNVRSDGALGWAPDFPIEVATQAVSTLLRSCLSEVRQSIQQHLLETFAAKVPDWVGALSRDFDAPAGTPT